MYSCNGVYLLVFVNVVNFHWSWTGVGDNLPSLWSFFINHQLEKVVKKLTWVGGRKINHAALPSPFHGVAFFFFFRFLSLFVCLFVRRSTGQDYLYCFAFISQ